MRLFLFFLLIASMSFAQDCTFDGYQKRGGIYYFSTFYQNYNPKDLREGVCSKEVNGAPYAYHEFKNGQLQVERLYNFETKKVYSEFKRVQHDSVIATLVYSQDGSNIEQRNTYYLNREGKRCYKEEQFRIGKLYQVRYFRNFTNQELIDAGYKSRPEHLIDADGYCDVIAQFGKELTYHPNGKLMSVKHHQLIVSDSPYLTQTQNGEYILYAENGVELQHGTYKNGQPNGEFIYHHLNGKLAAKRYFENGVSVGNWIDYYDDGSLFSTCNYGEAYYWPTGHEKRYSRNGNLIYERVIDKAGVGFQVDYFENGKLKEKTLYEHGPQERTGHFVWFASGQLQEKTYLRPSNDTLSAYYFEDGFLKSINLHKNTEGKQEIRSYYASHQIASDYVTVQLGGQVCQSTKNYNEKGVLVSSMELKNSIKVVKEFWQNGQLKFERNYNGNVLNGSWIEKDSLGNTMKFCHYKNGFRDSVCRVSPIIKLPRLSNQIKEKLHCLTLNSILLKGQAAKEVVRKNEIKVFEQLCETAFAYMLSIDSNYQLAEKNNCYTKVKYDVNIPASKYTNKKPLIDSLLFNMNWKEETPLKSNSQYTFGTFLSEDFYSPVLIDSLFMAVDSSMRQYITIQNQFYSDEDLDMYRRQNALSFVRKEAEKAWLVQLNGTYVVIYDDGIMEFYNATTVVPFAEPFQLKGGNIKINWE